MVMRFQESLGHHVIIKNVAKTRFLLGLAHLIAENAQTNSFINVQIRLGEIVTMLQTLESIAIAAVEGAVENPDNGVWYCNANAITAGLRLFPEYYVQIIDHIKQIGGSNFMAAPSEANMEAITEAIGPSVERYFKGAADMKEEGIDKVPCSASPGTSSAPRSPAARSSTNASSSATSRSPSRSPTSASTRQSQLRSCVASSIQTG